MKKIIALVTAAFLILSLFATNFVAYAAEDYTLLDYYKDYFSALGHFIKGEYSFDEYLGYVTSAGSKLSDTDVILNRVQPIVNKTEQIYNQYGPAAVDVINTAVSGLFSDYQTSETVSTTDLKGGACAIEYWVNDGIYHYFYSSKDNGRIFTYPDGRIEYYFTSYFYFWIVDRNGKYTREPTYGNWGSFLISTNEYKDFKLYGDWRYQDNTSAETNDKYATITKYDFTQKQDPNNPDNKIPTTELDLNKLIDELTAALENASPDLSSIESTLNAIYYKLGQLDSDNDNELLSEVLTAIKAIEGSSSSGDNTELLETLEAIKNSLVYENGENSETLADRLNLMIKNQITAEDFKIDEELRNNNGEILKLRLLGKFSFINTLKEFVTHIFDTYSQSSEIPEFSIEIYGEECKINMDIFKENLPLLQAILAAFIYISYGYHTYRKIPSYINGGDNE